MSEVYARFHQYEYRVNSNLVLTVENRTRVNEPTGEPETLVGRIIPGTMGIRARPDYRPPELTDRLERMRKRRREDDRAVKKKKKEKKKAECIRLGNL